MEELDPKYVSFLESWNEWINIISLIFIGVAVLLTIYHILKGATISDPKKKHDFIVANEINTFWYAMLSLSIAGGMYLNTIGNETVKEEVIWFFVRLFITASFTTIFALIFHSLIKVYYPFQVYKRLNKLRHKPRVNPSNGNTMKLMSEEEEDKYLTDEMIEEEALHAVDYDVWLDAETGFTLIEKYDGASLAIECPSCGYRTLRVVDEKVLRSPTIEAEGELENFYECSYCGHKEVRIVNTRKLHKKPEIGA
jgi:multisubunit Na+/H+ antiporter MnhF subunit/Zn finger protein HypA/HybF involved in hydrogenase expression